jgi:TolB-like protein/Flp pilus assembly protein TadD
MALAPGTRLGAYEILSPLAAGGMGEVYRARDTKLDRAVAVKVLPERLSDDAESLARFEREAKAVAALSHPNILAIHDFGTHDGVCYAVMELLEGETLRERLERGPVPRRPAVDYALQVARGLAAAHERGFVHRDIKPENLFVTRDGHVKILDFGLAKKVPVESAGDETSAPTVTGRTEPGTVMGTLSYMSPEQVRGLPLDHRTDIFSFGAVLYEMLSGRKAFAGPTAADTGSAILNSEPPEIPAPAGAADPLVSVIRHCLEKDPKNRFQSAGDVAFALKEATPGVPPVAREPIRVGRTALFVLAAAGILAAAALAFLYARRTARRGPAATAGIASLAVLPLENLSRDPAQEYFSDGMTDELITNLARIGSLRVISRTSVMSYKGTRKPLSAIARELGVDGVVEGSVMRSGDQVRITAQLIHGPTDRHLWAQSYQRDLRDVLAMQSEVARAIAGEIRTTLTPQDDQRLGGARRVDPAAHELYLKGRYALNDQSEAGIRNAIALFRQAIEKDPRFAPAYAGLSDSYSYLRSTYAAPKDVMPQAKEAARRALELDETLAEAHVSQGQIDFFYDFDWIAAEKEFRRAIELNPNLAEAHDGYASYLTGMNRPGEAIREIERAENLDPRSPVILADAGWVFYCARDYPRAERESRRALEIDPGNWVAIVTLGVALEKQGKVEDAIATLETARRSDDSPTILEMLGGAYAAGGKTGKAGEILASLQQRAARRYVCPYEIATVHAGLGDRDAAFRTLEQAVDEKADCIPWIQADPKIDPLRADPRYAPLLRRIGLTP